VANRLSTGTGPAEQCELPSHGTKTTSNTITVSPAIAPVLRSPAARQKAPGEAANDRTEDELAKLRIQPGKLNCTQPWRGGTAENGFYGRSWTN
jgi:hypothetical protein